MAEPTPEEKAELRKADPAVVHPSHYNMGAIEVIDAVNEWRLDFNSGNAVKYIVRAPHKGKQLEDLRKARFYLDDAIKRLERAEAARKP